MAQGFYELKVAKDGQFMFNLKAANGQVILTSELYKTKASARKRYCFSDKKWRGCEKL